MGRIPTGMMLLGYRSHADCKDGCGLDLIGSNAEFVTKNLLQAWPALQIVFLRSSIIEFAIMRKKCIYQTYDIHEIPSFHTPANWYDKMKKDLSDLHQHPTITSGPKSTPRTAWDHHHSLAPAYFAMLPKLFERNAQTKVKGITLGHRGYSVISQVGDSVALVRSSEGDVYYRKWFYDCWWRMISNCSRCMNVGGCFAYSKVDWRKKKLMGASTMLYMLLAAEILAWIFFFGLPPLAMTHSTCANQGQ